MNIRSARRRQAFPGLEENDLEIDMSPMIDLVFLLLIFFMTGSTMFSYLQDPRVALPVADAAQVPRTLRSRLLVNVYENGTYADEQGHTMSLEELREHFRGALLADPGIRLFVRSDRRVAHGAVRRLLNTAADAGLDRVIFAAYTTDP
jgi:biopolymer transport protein ExbD